MPLLELSPAFRKENVIVWNAALPEAHAFGYLFDALVNGPVKFDPMPVWTDMQKRTAMGVYMGNGLLLPHARVKNLEMPLLAVGICNAGISMAKNANGEVPKLVAMVLSPEESPAAHTRMVGAIAKLILNQEFVQKLLSAKTRDEAFKLIAAC